MGILEAEGCDGEVDAAGRLALEAEANGNPAGEFESGAAVEAAPDWLEEPVAKTGVLVVPAADLLAAAEAEIAEGHDPAGRSGPHELHALQDHHAYSCRRELQEQEAQLRIGLEEMHRTTLGHRH